MQSSLLASKVGASLRQRPQPLNVKSRQCDSFGTDAGQSVTGRKSTRHLPTSASLNQTDVNPRNRTVASQLATVSVAHLTLWSYVLCFFFSDLLLRLRLSSVVPITKEGGVGDEWGARL